jgi:hypothetical protein
VVSHGSVEVAAGAGGTVVESHGSLVVTGGGGTEVTSCI